MINSWCEAQICQDGGFEKIATCSCLDVLMTQEITARDQFLVGINLLAFVFSAFRKASPLSSSFTLLSACWHRYWRAVCISYDIFMAAAPGKGVGNGVRGTWPGRPSVLGESFPDLVLYGYKQAGKVPDLVCQLFVFLHKSFRLQP